MYVRRGRRKNQKVAGGKVSRRIGGVDGERSIRALSWSLPRRTGMGIGASGFEGGDRAVHAALLD